MRALSSPSQIARIGTLRGAVERAELAAQPQRVAVLQRQRHDHQVVFAFGGVEQRLVRIAFDVHGVLGRQRRRQPLGRRRAVIDDQHAPGAAGVGDRLVLGILNADLPRGQRAHAQLVGHHLEPRQRAHPRDQRHVGHRLGQEIVGAGVEPLDPVGRMIERRHHDHRNVVGRAVGLDAAAYLEAVHVRHHHVEQDDIALGLLAFRQRLAAAHGGDNVEILSRQPGFQKLHVGRNIVNDEYARCHGLKLLRHCQENGGSSR